MIQVLCGFPGVGKSTLFRELDGKKPVCDSDSSTFDKAEFPQNYIAHIQQKIDEGYFVLCSTHEVVRKALAEAGIKYAIAYPTSDAKYDYAMRYKKRGSPAAFITLMDQQWGNFLSSCVADQNAAMHIVVPKYCYITRNSIQQVLLFDLPSKAKPVEALSSEDQEIATELVERLAGASEQEIATALAETFYPLLKTHLDAVMDRPSFMRLFIEKLKEKEDAQPGTS